MKRSRHHAIVVGEHDTQSRVVPFFTGLAADRDATRRLGAHYSRQTQPPSPRITSLPWTCIGYPSSFRWCVYPSCITFNS